MPPLLFYLTTPNQTIENHPQEPCFSVLGDGQAVPGITKMQSTWVMHIGVTFHGEQKLSVGAGAVTQ